MCASQGDPVSGLLWEKYCQPDPHFSAGALRDTEYIFVCPQFWHAFSAAPLAENCPDIQNNKMVPNWDKFSDSMYGIIIHELAHVYGIYHDVDMKEVYNIQDAADLRASYQIKNAANYAFYASGELSFL